MTVPVVLFACLEKSWEKKAANHKSRKTVMKYNVWTNSGQSRFKFPLSDSLGHSGSITLPEPNLSYKVLLLWELNIFFILAAMYIWRKSRL